MNEYFALLFNQFNESVGYKKIYLNSDDYINEFVNWLENLKKISHLYSEFANYEGIDLYDDGYIELNKGKCDSMKNTNIISPFASTLGIQNAKLVVCQGEPNIIIGSNVKKGQVVDTYTTFNPYSDYYLNDLDVLHNCGINICYGIFGKNSDINMEIKVKKFLEFVSKLKDDHICSLENIDGNYVGIVFSKRKNKKLSLIR